MDEKNKYLKRFAVVMLILALIPGIGGIYMVCSADHMENDLNGYGGLARWILGAGLILIALIFAAVSISVFIYLLIKKLERK